MTRIIYPKRQGKWCPADKSQQTFCKMPEYFRLLCPVIELCYYNMKIGTDNMKQEQCTTFQ